MYFYPSEIRTKLEFHAEDMVNEFGFLPDLVVECPESIAYDMDSAYVLIGASAGWPAFVAHLDVNDGHLVLSDEMTDMQRSLWEAAVEAHRATAEQRFARFENEGWYYS